MSFCNKSNDTLDDCPFMFCTQFRRNVLISLLFSCLATASSEEKTSDGDLGRPVVVLGKQKFVLIFTYLIRPT